MARKILARRLRVFRPAFKISTRECDWSHQPLTLADRVRLWFAAVEWIRPFGRPEPVVRTARYTYYFVRTQA